MKNWTIPQIDELDISQTALEVLQGRNPDGEYEDENCELQWAYWS